MFENMISKSLVQVLWVVMSIGVVISTWVSYQALWNPTFGAFLVHLIYAVIGLIFVRVLCEGLIIIFMMHENLSRSRTALEEIQSQQASIASALRTQSVMARTMSQQAAIPAPAASPISTSPAPKISRPVERSGWEQAYSTGGTERSPDETSSAKSKLGDWAGGTSSRS